MAWQRTGSSRSRRRTGSSRRSSGGRRKFTWISNVFAPNDLAASTIVELELASVGELLGTALSRGTVVSLYGRVALCVATAEDLNDEVSGAWGIRLKESDAATTTTTFSPLTDGDSTGWMQWRGFSLVKTTGTGVFAGANPVGYQDDNFVIHNPRKIEADQELVLNIHNGAASSGALTYAVWIRAGIALP